MNENLKLFVCLDNEIISQLNEYVKSKSDPMVINAHIKKCCKFDFETLRCLERDNYLIVNFTKECTYQEGFQNSYRTNIEKILLDGEEYSIDKNLEIKSNSQLIIYFDSTLESLSHFFSSEIDPNVININLIDLSHFDASNIKDLSNLFEGCTSLESVNFTNFEKATLTD